jgi:alkylation response protein AidB-like acyl-CoA dehydrogenase
MSTAEGPSYACVVPTSVADLDRAVREIAARWRTERAERQQRRHLEPADFTGLRDAGLLTLAAPRDAGGLWEGVEASVRPVCEIHRALARGDPSVALVASMHPAVIAFWLTTPDAGQPALTDQHRAVFASAVAGRQFGTITSEPGSGGDITRTRARAEPLDGEHTLPGDVYAVSGDKHFGSGSGVTDFMMTTAVPDGETEPAIFVLDVRGRPWDASAGLQLVAEWDGAGMAATQSHAMRLQGMPAVRFAWDGPLDALTRAAGPFISMLFTSVILGIVDEAIERAREQLAPRAESLRAYEQVEWTRAEHDHWLAVQAYEGGLRAVESGDPAPAFHGALRAKEAAAELAEGALLRLTRVLGGGTFSRRSPFAGWFEDVRALGFLRPPWGLAYDGLFLTSFG